MAKKLSGHGVMRAELVTDALQMALAQRRPVPGLIWHSDQGSQFNGIRFNQLDRQRLKRIRYQGANQASPEEVTAA